MHVNALTETTPKQEWFYRWRPLTFFPYSSFLSVFHKFSHLARVSVTTGSMRRYLDPTEVAQAVQRLQDGTLICAIVRRFAVSPSTVSRAWGRFQETGSYSGRAGQGCRRSLQVSRPNCHHWTFVNHGLLIIPIHLIGTMTLSPLHL